MHGDRLLARSSFRSLVTIIGTPLSEDELLEAFWPKSHPNAARNSLRVTASRARRVLDLPGTTDSAIQVSDRIYWLDLGERGSVDHVRFEAAADSALAGEGDDRATMVRRAIELWTGNPLPQDRYEDWAISWRERLIDRYAQLLVAQIEECGRAGSTSEAVRAARALVELDPTDELSQRQLMAAYARAGRRGHALRQYLECRRTLLEDLGLEPSAETTALQTRILAGDLT